MNIEEVENRIRKYNASYRSGNPEVSDAEYDELLDSYAKEVIPARYAEFRRTLFEDPGEIKHPHIMGSLEKVKNDDPDNSLGDWIVNNIFPNDTGMLFVSAKVDGCSLRLEYKDGKLVDAVTRGDGITGFSILGKAKVFVPTELPNGFTGNIRGECTLTHESFDELKSATGLNYKNLRNATVGLVNRKDCDMNLCRFLHFIAYHMMDESTLTKMEQFERLDKMGFETPAFHRFAFDRDPQKHMEFCTVLDSWMMARYNDFLTTVPYDIDGLVINDFNETDFTTGGKIPVNMIAFKPNQLAAHTKLMSIEWQISKSGYFTPVGIVDPVELGGATISRVTLNNHEFVAKSELAIGTDLDILKSGDIIPKVVKVSHESETGTTADLVPSICPYCGSKLVVEGCELRCPNRDCSEQHLIKTVAFIKELGVKNYDTAVLKELGVVRIEDVKNYVSDGSVRGKKLESSIRSHVFGASELDLLAAFDWNGIGHRILEKMANHYGFDYLLNPCFSDMKNNTPEGVGDAFIDMFEAGHAENVGYFNMFTSDPRYHGKKFSKVEAVVGGKLAGMSFCVTGELATMSREAFVQKVIQNGGLSKDSVTKKVTHLVTNNPNSNSSKNRKARELGIKVITEEQFLSMLGEGREDLEAL